MPKAGNSGEKAAARRVQVMLDIKFGQALSRVQEVKTDEIMWSEAAERVIEAALGKGLGQAAE